LDRRWVEGEILTYRSGKVVQSRECIPDSIEFTDSRHLIRHDKRRDDDVDLETIFLDVELLRKFTERVFEKLGVPAEDARIAADVLMEADLRAFDCHGVARLFPCYNRIRKGLIETKPNIDITWVTPTTGCCDGGNGLGMVVGYRAMKACLSRAEEFGSAFLAISRSNHFGIAGYYSSMALAENMIGITMSNASPRVVPTGGTTGILGTNPISVAVPRRTKPPVVLDMATSAMSSGKLDVALRKGVEIPEGWVYPSVKPFLDEDGVVPMSVLQYPLGGRAETGGYKGYGLALMVDILCGALSGANFGSRLAASKKAVEANIGHFLGAMKISGFRQREEFDRDLELLIEDVKSSPREPGVEQVFIPGEPEASAKGRHWDGGIPVSPQVWKKLQQIAMELDLPLPG
jgi:L-2-hydroxycarboxylate dehydrogenase (NAD+)